MLDGLSCTQTGTISVTSLPCTLECAASVPSTGGAGAPLSFQATATPSNCTGTPAFAWTFGDGGTSTAQNPSHTYGTSGNFAWGLTVSVDGQTCTKTGSVAVSPSPLIAGESEGCSSPGVALETEAGYAAYQWKRDGSPIPGANAPTYTATLSGSYTVTVTGGGGLSGTSPGHSVAITFCPSSEVAPPAGMYPARLLKTSASSTGFVLRFQKTEGATGYNLYEGDLGSWYSHGGGWGNLCNADPADLGTGEMEVEVAPSDGSHYYLVTAFAEKTEGPSGYDSGGNPIDPEQSACDP